MNIRGLLYQAVLLVMMYPLGAQTMTRRATITGNRGPGSCTIEVNVDHAAQLELHGDTAHLTTLGGQTARWRAFRCNVPIPDRPGDFRIARINGRGRVTLLKEPRHNRGAALIHIIDSDNGRGNYSINVAWHGAEADGGPVPPPTPPGTGNGDSVRHAIRVCQEAVTDRIVRNGYSFVSFERTLPGDPSWEQQWVRGFAIGRRHHESRDFSFSCSVDSWSGRVRFIDVRPR